MKGASPTSKAIRSRFYRDYVPPRQRYLDSASALTSGETTRILDVGCGRNPRELRQIAASVGSGYGVDLVESIDQSGDGVTVHLTRGDCDRLPFDGAVFDLVISKSVLEHLQHPATVFREIHRVLRPGGSFVFLTPNRWDYVSLGASLVPNRFHPTLVGFLTTRAEQDTFPTHYRANTVRRLRQLAVDSDLEVVTLELVRESPHYLKRYGLLYAGGAIYDRLVANPVKQLRPWLLGVMRRPRKAYPSVS